METRFVELLKNLTAHPGEGLKWNLYGFNRSRIDRDIATVKGRIDRLESSRARVWRLEELGRLSDEETASRIEELRLKRWDLDLKLLRLTEERMLLEAAKFRADDVELLHRTAFARFESGDSKERAAIAREVVVSLGGLRVALNGELITGTGPDLTVHRRLPKLVAPPAKG